MNTFVNPYIFEWIDLLISQVLHPDKKDLRTIPEDQLEVFSLRIQQENFRLQSAIRNRLFSIKKRSKKNLLIRQYHSTLTVLHYQLLQHQNHPGIQRADLKKLAKLIQACLEELLSFIEARYFDHLSLEEQAPATYLITISTELKRRLDALAKKLSHRPHNPAADLVLGRLNHFISTTFYESKVTYRMAFYKKTLLKGLEDLKWEPQDPGEFTELDKLLIYLNFNSKTYINLFTHSLIDKVRKYESSYEKLEILLFYYKAFKQIHPKRNTILNPQYYPLQTIINNWFGQEIYYLKEILHLPLTPLQNRGEMPGNKQQSLKVKHKILCNLSTDQMALILRAADEAKILISRSMNEVFKTIVPHLSTPHKQDLSYNAVRSKIYNIENRDKEIAVETLERIITKIKDL